MTFYADENKFAVTVLYLEMHLYIYMCVLVIN